MNILVIGNGFDLAHGLPTMYSDYLHFITAFRKRIEGHSAEIATDYNAYFDSLKHNQPAIYKELHDMTSDNLWLNYFASILDQQIKLHKDGWIDFEGEMASVIKFLDKTRVDINLQLAKGRNQAYFDKYTKEKLISIFGKIYESSDTFITMYRNKLLEHLDKLIRGLEIYLGSYIQTQYDKCHMLADIINIKPQYILSFNYTDTFEKIYNVDGRYDNIDYDFIHGRADLNHDVSQCNMVVGIDEYLGDKEKNEDNEFVQFKKFYQRIYKMTGAHYIDWINDYVNHAKDSNNISDLNIFIYGHSLDVTDKDILRELMLAENAKTTIYYHSKVALGKQIANLVKVIGEEELIIRCRGTDPIIKFQETTKDYVDRYI